jgi:flagellar biosynthesis protein FlhG
MATKDGGMKLWSIGGGKGGVGKSLVTLGLGISLARMGQKVILIDGDLGGANLHTLMGIRYPQITLAHFLNKKAARLEDTIIETSFENIGLICGADDLLGGANPTYAQKIRLLNQIEELPANYILIDLGAGTSFNTLDFFNYSEGKIALFTSQAPSLQNAYGFIKSALYRKLSRDFAKDEGVLRLLYQGDGSGTPENISSIQDLLNYFEHNNLVKHEQLSQTLGNYRLFLMANMVKSNHDLKYGDIIDSLCLDFLNIRSSIIGHIPFDSKVDPAISQRMPITFYQDTKSKAMAELNQTAKRLVSESRIN